MSASHPKVRRALPAALLTVAAAVALAVLSAGLTRTVLTALGPRPQVWTRRGEVMKTGFLAKAVMPESGAVEAAAALDAAFSAAAEAERLMSRFRPESDVSRLSASPPGTPVKVDPRTFRVLALARDVHRRSGGAFDVTIGPLVRLYRCTGREEQRPPTAAEIAAALARVGSEKLLLDPRGLTARLKTAGMTVDLSAVAKGFSVDLAVGELRARGARAALAEIGGEVRGFGTRPDGRPWRVAVQHPRADRLMAVLDLQDCALATSGDYRKFFRRNGRRASHIIDPRTGRPLVGGAISVTVMAPSCALADALATAISVLGPARGLELVAGYRREGQAVEALIVEEDAAGRLSAHRSPGFGKLKLEL
jgi:thiamine biosynthesis lipoprotein